VTLRKNTDSARQPRVFLRKSYDHANFCKLEEDKKHDRRPKLDDDVVDRIRVMHEDEGWGYRRLARHFDTPRDTIRSLCKYRRR